MTDPKDLIAQADAALEGVTPERCYLIKKGGLYYRSNFRGYTTSATQAGRYTLDEAIKESHPNGPDGPRDGMTYQHEDNARDDDWLVVRELRQLVPALRDALAAALTRAELAECHAEALEAENARLRDALTKISKLTATTNADENTSRLWETERLSRAALTGEPQP